MTVRYPGFDTLALHAGQPPDPTTGSRAVPIYATASYVFDDSDHAAALFNMERAGHVYSRISNPTVAVFEERMAALEKGVGAVATASGQAALHLAIVTLMGAGTHIVASRALYGGSHNLLGFTLARFGIDTTFVDPRDLDAWRTAIRPDTRLLFGETLGNPGLDVLDIPAVSAIAHEHGLPLLVDSTFTTPYLMTPFDHGADLLYHSATKFIGGHGVAIGGVLVDGGTFDWLHSGKFATLTQPYVGFHGMNFAEESTVAPFLLRARREGLRDFGACMSPHTAFFLLQGLETLPLRMQRHVDNTRKVVAFLTEHPMVQSVAYPELASHPDHALAQRLLPRGCGAVFSFELKGSRNAGRAFVEALRVFSHLANVGDAKSLVIHPASTTHFRVPDNELAAAGITQGTIRLSVGLEDAGDLLDDLAQALKRAENRLMDLVTTPRLYAYTGGKTFDPALPTIVFLHGGEHDHSVWILQSRYLAHHGYSVLALDLPGHMRSAGPALTSIEAMADRIATALDACGAERVLVVGHSMGSLIALELGNRLRGKVAGVALIATAFPMRVSDALLDATRSAPPAAMEMINVWSHSTSIAAFDRKPCNPGPGFSNIWSNLRLMQRVAQRNGADVLHADFAACNAYQRGTDAAAALDCPALFILAASDLMTPARAAQSLIDVCRDPTVVTLRSSGHALMAEDPDGVRETLLRFAARAFERAAA